MKVVIYIDQRERFDFFSRFEFGAYEPIFVAVRYSLYRLALKKGFRCIFVKQGAGKRSVDVGLCRDVMAGYLSIADAKKLYNNVWDAVRECFSEITPLHSVWLWNGSDVAEKAVSDFAKEQSVRTVFLEISNIPGRLFVDVNGVNCCSTIYLTKGRCLDPVFTDSGEWGRFKEKYIREKNSNSTVPQAKVARSINLAFLFDYFGQKVLGGSVFQSRSIFTKLLTVVGRKRPPVENPGLVPERYLFLPFQVSTDSQILLNSEVDNASALEFAVQEAEKLSASLVIKLHPAESSSEARATLIRMCSEKGVVLTNENTFKLVSEAQKVITINSTVGLEALISGVEVGFLGRSFYEYLNTEERLSKYVLGWLYGCDYFGNDKVCFEGLVQHVEMIETV